MLSFTILTQDACTGLSHLHDRMPVMLASEGFGLGLSGADPGLRHADRARAADRASLAEDELAALQRARMCQARPTAPSLRPERCEACFR